VTAPAAAVSIRAPWAIQPQRGTERTMARQMEITGDNTQQVVENDLQTGGKDGERSTVFKDIEQTLGVVPGFFKMLPSSHLQAEWKIFKDFELSDQTALSPKVKELIGLAVAAQMQCEYCTFFHTASAGMHGATAREIDEALLVGKSTAGWSTFLSGARYDMDQLKREMRDIHEHMKKVQGGPRA
jgi:AhpD family alkylhydroperoxidase